MSNYFSLLTLPQRYRVDLLELEKNYREQSKKLHPDRNPNLLASQRIEMLGKSAELNQAYKILKDDFNRAAYLLLLEGIDVKSEISKIPLDPLVLGEILELKEQLIDADSLEKMSPLKYKVEDELKTRWNQIETLFNSSRIDFGEIAALLIIIPYFNRLKSEIIEAELHILQGQ